MLSNIIYNEDCVLDNCIGSGTTDIACLNTNRNYIGCELDKTYYDICIKRIEEHIPTTGCAIVCYQYHRLCVTLPLTSLSQLYKNYTVDR